MTTNTETMDHDTFITKLAEEVADFVLTQKHAGNPIPEDLNIHIVDIANRIFDGDAINPPPRVVSPLTPRFAVKRLTELTKIEKSLLLLAECCMVDDAGIYQRDRINDEDREVMDRWKAEGFIDHGRVASEHVTPNKIVWIKLSPEAMTLAQEVRRERAQRMWENRKW